MKPDEIENLSFQIIEREIGAHNLRNEQWIIVRRMIHTSADFGYKDMIRFHPDAIKSGLDAIRSGKNIITDTNMARVFRDNAGSVFLFFGFLRTFHD